MKTMELFEFLTDCTTIRTPWGFRNKPQKDRERILLNRVALRHVSVKFLKEPILLKSPLKIGTIPFNDTLCFIYLSFKLKEPGAYIAFEHLIYSQTEYYARHSKLGRALK